MDTGTLPTSVSTIKGRSNHLANTCSKGFSSLAMHRSLKGSACLQFERLWLPVLTREYHNNCEEKAIVSRRCSINLWMKLYLASPWRYGRHYTTKEMGFNWKTYCMKQYEQSSTCFKSTGKYDLQSSLLGSNHGKSWRFENMTLELTFKPCKLKFWKCYMKINLSNFSNENLSIGKY